MNNTKQSKTAASVRTAVIDAPAIHEYAQQCVTHGIAITLIQEKKPYIKGWNDAANHITTMEAFKRHYRTGAGVGILLGKPSGNLCVLDLEYAGIWERLHEEVRTKHPGLYERVVIKCAQVRTTSGGGHLYMRVSDEVLPSKAATVLAHTCSNPGNGKPQSADGSWLAAEFLSTGKQCVSIASVMPQGKGQYTQANAVDIWNTQHVSNDNLNTLVAIVRSFDEVPAKAEQATQTRLKSQPSAPTSERIGDQYNADATASHHDLLTRYGCRHLYTQGDNEHWERPGKNEGSTSATWSTSKQCLYVFSTNAAPFEAGQSYSKFAMFALLEHDGDYTAATRALAKQYDPKLSQGLQTPWPQSADDEWAWLKDTEKRPSDKAAFEQLARLTRADYDRKRSDAAKALGVRAQTLDVEVDFERARLGLNGEQKRTVYIEDTEPCDEPVDVGAVLDEVNAQIKKYIACDEETRIAATLWCAFSWQIDHAEISPLATITSPQKRCGKTLIATVMGKMVKRPLHTSNISASAMYRIMDEEKPTLIADETDTFLKDEAQTGILNAGHTKDSAFVFRCDGEDNKPRAFSTWGAKILAGIGKRTDTIMDRSIELKMRRKLPHEKVERLRHGDKRVFANIRAKLARMEVDYGPTVAKARPALPKELNDRAQDNWEPLLAIADLAGGDWPAKARRAALVLSVDDAAVQTLAEALLEDIAGILEALPADQVAIFSVSLTEELCKDPTRPWAAYNQNRDPMNQQQLATMLGTYGLKPENVRIKERRLKGYKRVALQEVLARYFSMQYVSTPYPENSRTAVPGINNISIDISRITNTGDLTGTAVGTADFSGRTAVPRENHKSIFPVNSPSSLHEKCTAVDGNVAQGWGLDDESRPIDETDHEDF